MKNSDRILVTLAVLGCLALIWLIQGELRP